MLEEHIYSAVTAYATVATAIPAILVAYLGWTQARQTVSLETTQTIRQPLHEAPRFELQLTLRNRRRSAILPWGVEAVGLPVISVQVVGQSKGPNWTASSAPFPSITIDPGNARGSLVLIVPDWESAKKLAGDRGLRWRVRVRYEDCGGGRTYRCEQLVKFSADQINRYVSDLPSHLRARR